MSRLTIGVLLLLCLLAAEAIQAARVDHLDSILKGGKDKDKKDKDQKDKGKGDKGKDKGKDDKNAPAKPINVKINHVCKVIDPKKFANFFALGDLHGVTDHVALFASAGLIDSKKQWIAKSTVLVITGDTVHGGPESAPVWNFIQSLIAQAPKHGSEVVLLMGNHESDHAAQIDDADVKGAKKQFGADYPKVQAAMSKLPVCAVLGKIMFAHSGFIDAKWDKDQATFAKNIQKYWNDLKETLDGKKFQKLLKEDGPGSIVCKHDWVKDKKMFKHNRKALALMGYDMLIAGHEAKLFGKDISIGNAIAVNKGLHFVKLDVGMKPDILAPKKSFPGSILKCPMSVATDTKIIVTACSTASSKAGTPNQKAGNKVVVTTGGDDGDKNDD